MDLQLDLGSPCIPAVIQKQGFINLRIALIFICHFCCVYRDSHKKAIAIMLKMHADDLYSPFHHYISIYTSFIQAIVC